MLMQWSGLLVLLAIVAVIVAIGLVRAFLLRSIQRLYAAEFADLDERLRVIELRCGNGGEK